MTIINNCTSIFMLLIILSQYVQAHTGEPESNSGSPNEGHNSKPSSLTIIINITAVLSVFVFMAIFYFFIRFCTNDTFRNDIGALRSGSFRRSRGLDPKVIDGFPILDYAAVKATKIGNNALECAVCLTKFEDDDNLRLLPRCDHVFHPDCIDAWLVGHTTCPVCRCNLAETLDNDVEQLLVVNVDEVREINNNNNDRVNEENKSMERSLHERMRRSRTMRNQSFGRPRWFGKFVRSLSTGHVEVKTWESMERFTLRLPEDVRKQIMSGKLKSRNSARGLYQSRGLFGSLRDRASRSWGFSLTPPFLTPAPSMRSLDGETTLPTHNRASSWSGPSLGNVSKIRKITM